MPIQSYVIALAGADGLGADALADAVRLTHVLERVHVAARLDHPHHLVAVHFGEDELGVVAQVDVALLDGLDRRRPAAHHV